MSDLERMSLIHDVRFAMDWSRLLARCLDGLGDPGLAEASGHLAMAAESLEHFLEGPE